MRPEPLEGQEPLEGLESFTPSISTRRGGEGLRAPKAPATGEKKGPSFKRYRSANPHKCDSCIAAMLGGGKWSAPERATYEVTVDGKVTFLCFGHSNDVRATYGLEALKRG